MKSTPELREQLHQISTALLRIHKNLLENEMQERESKLHITLGPNERLHALLNDPTLDWLRSLSQLVASIDEVYFQKEPITTAQFETELKKVTDLIIENNDSVFLKKYRSLLPTVPDLMQQHGLLRLALTKKK
ncbi:MAG: hypothetical protein JNL11_16550 [Bdellovibrionaceae bacterium]|nr:hypothetical protein [Pseudobdellovibrionaceae bacterium]